MWGDILYSLSLNSDHLVSVPSPPLHQSTMATCTALSQLQNTRLQLASKSDPGNILGLGRIETSTPNTQNHQYLHLIHSHLDSVRVCNPERVLLAIGITASGILVASGRGSRWPKLWDWICWPFTSWWSKVPSLRGEWGEGKMSCSLCTVHYSWDSDVNRWVCPNIGTQLILGCKKLYTDLTG